MPANEPSSGKSGKNHNQGKPRSKLYNPSLIYEEIKHLGSGAFGAAFLVRRKRDGRRFVAKKCCIEGLSEKQRKMCLEEIALLRRVRHECVAQYVDFRWSSADKMNYWLMLKFYEGGDVDHRIAHCRDSDEEFEEELIKSWITQLCMALEHVHNLHIVHRDVKPANMFLTGLDTLVLGDFGVSKQLSENTEKALTSVGSPTYMAPEWWDGRGGTAASDIWSVGIVFFELTVLRRPFEAGNVLSLVHKITTEDPPDLPVECDFDMREFVKQLLDKDPERRPSASEALRCRCLGKCFETLNYWRTHMDRISDKNVQTTALAEDIASGITYNPEGNDDNDEEESFESPHSGKPVGVSNLVALARAASMTHRPKAATAAELKEEEDIDDEDEEESDEDEEEEETGEDEEEEDGNADSEDADSDSWQDGTPLPMDEALNVLPNSTRVADAQSSCSSETKVESGCIAIGHEAEITWLSNTCEKTALLQQTYAPSSLNVSKSIEETRLSDVRAALLVAQSDARDSESACPPIETTVFLEQTFNPKPRRSVTLVRNNEAVKACQGEVTSSIGSDCNDLPGEILVRMDSSTEVNAKNALSNMNVSDLDSSYTTKGTKLDDVREALLSVALEFSHPPQCEHASTSKLVAMERTLSPASKDDDVQSLLGDAAQGSSRTEVSQKSASNASTNPFTLPATTKIDELKSSCDTMTSFNLTGANQSPRGTGSALNSSDAVKEEVARLPTIQVTQCNTIESKSTTPHPTIGASESSGKNSTDLLKVPRGRNSLTLLSGCSDSWGVSTTTNLLCKPQGCDSNGRRNAADVTGETMRSVEASSSELKQKGSADLRAQTSITSSSGFSDSWGCATALATKSLLENTPKRQPAGQETHGRELDVLRHALGEAAAPEKTMLEQTRLASLEITRNSVKHVSRSEGKARLLDDSADLDPEDDEEGEDDEDEEEEEEEEEEEDEEEEEQEDEDDEEEDAEDEAEVCEDGSAQEKVVKEGEEKDEEEEEEAARAEVVLEEQAEGDGKIEQVLDERQQPQTYNIEIQRVETSSLSLDCTSVVSRNEESMAEKNSITDDEHEQIEVESPPSGSRLRFSPIIRLSGNTVPTLEPPAEVDTSPLASFSVPPRHIPARHLQHQRVVAKSKTVPKSGRPPRPQ